MAPQHDGKFFLSTENLTSRRALRAGDDWPGALAAQWTKGRLACCCLLWTWL